jgi:hypothetical protein
VGIHKGPLLPRGVCMFGRQIKFIRAREHVSLIQCARCHELGHNASSSKCSVPKQESRCYICGKGHDSQHHSFECPGPHKVPGVCDCIPKCLLCKQSGHNLRDKRCPRRGDFALPRLPNAAPVEARPPVEDTAKADAIPYTRRACPVQGREGKAKANKLLWHPHQFPQIYAPMTKMACPSYSVSAAP